jgi:hypothetical protein
MLINIKVIAFNLRVLLAWPDLRVTSDSSNSTEILVFVIEVHCVYSEVRTEILTGI